MATTLTAMGNAKITTSNYKWNSSSATLDGSGDYIKVNSMADFDLGNGNWTVDWWENRNSFSNGASPFSAVKDNASNRAFVLNTIASSTLRYCRFFFTDSTSWSQYIGTVPSTGVWNHYAAVRDGTNFYFYENGTRVTNEPNFSTKSIHPFYRAGVGRNEFESTADFDGYIDEFRFSKGIARWTGSSFTLPTEEYSPDQYDILLLHMTGENNSTTFTNSFYQPLAISKTYYNGTWQTTPAKTYYNGSWQATPPKLYQSGTWQG